MFCNLLSATKPLVLNDRISATKPQKMSTSLATRRRKEGKGGERSREGEGGMELHTSALLPESISSAITQHATI